METHDDQMELDLPLVKVHVVKMPSEEIYAADFGGWRTFPLSTEVQQILPRRLSRDRAVIWVVTTVDSGVGIILNSDRSACQQLMGGTLNQQGQQITVENQQPLYAVLTAEGAADISIAVLDESWDATPKNND
jgi:hypothetical protein